MKNIWPLVDEKFHFIANWTGPMNKITNDQTSAVSWVALQLKIITFHSCSLFSYAFTIVLATEWESGRVTAVYCRSTALLFIVAASSNRILNWPWNCDMWQFCGHDQRAMCGTTFTNNRSHKIQLDHASEVKWGS